MSGAFVDIPVGNRETSNSKTVIEQMTVSVAVRELMT